MTVRRSGWARWTDAPVVVVGGGPVGSALGLSLPGAIVLERKRFPRDKACGEGLLPAGAHILRGLGLDLAELDFFPLHGIRYRVPGKPSVATVFARGPGFGVRRLRLDALLAERAGVSTGVVVTGLRVGPDQVEVETDRGSLRAGIVIAADGLRSSVARGLGWARPSAGSRFALVGHLAAQPRVAEVQVTLLGAAETYLAPVGTGELLLAVMGDLGALRGGESAVVTYRRVLAQAHPELADASLIGRLRGAGPFQVRAHPVARGRVFLAGDAAGFLDPLTGDGLTAGLVQAVQLAGLLKEGPEAAAGAYRRWFAGHWRRRVLMSRLALGLTGHPAVAGRAIRGLARRPAALRSLIEVSEGSRNLSSLGPRDWAALAGIGR